jgi:hypothetical protein
LRMSIGSLLSTCTPYVVASLPREQTEIGHGGHALRARL